MSKKINHILWDMPPLRVTTLNYIADGLLCGRKFGCWYIYIWLIPCAVHVVGVAMHSH